VLEIQSCAEQPLRKVVSIMFVCVTTPLESKAQWTPPTVLVSSSCSGNGALRLVTIWRRLQASHRGTNKPNGCHSKSPPGTERSCGGTASHRGQQPRRVGIQNGTIDRKFRPEKRQGSVRDESTHSQPVAQCAPGGNESRQRAFRRQGQSRSGKRSRRPK